MNSCILGSGAWGTAMALHLNRCAQSVSIAPRRIEQAISLTKTRENEAYLPGLKLPDSIQIGYELEPLLMETNVLFLACPSKGIRRLSQRILKETKAQEHIDLIVILCKGLEQESLKFPYEIVQEAFPSMPIGILSGPSFAREVAQGNPTALSMAVSGITAKMEQIQNQISNDKLRVYLSNDIQGVQLGGILKNIYAIGAGLCDGLNLGDNAKSAYITRALNEMLVIGESLGGQKETFYGLSGFGDLIATCFGQWSRNRTLGQAVGQGSDPQSIIADQKAVVEGYSSVESLYKIAQRKGLDMPILKELYAILYSNKSPKVALNSLMMRDLKLEA